jgi:SNF2-related domain
VSAGGPETSHTAFTNYSCSFCHTITEAKSPISPSETVGGVLADDMGMGKSLSILSLITKTLGNAHVWASSGIKLLANDIRVRKRASRANLVVVPSACKCSRISALAIAEIKASNTKQLALGD